jgi:hypothetical protein
MSKVVCRGGCSRSAPFGCPIGTAAGRTGRADAGIESIALEVPGRPSDGIVEATFERSA